MSALSPLDPNAIAAAYLLVLAIVVALVQITANVVGRPKKRR
jgi:hypothetical protein